MGKERDTQFQGFAKLLVEELRGIVFFDFPQSDTLARDIIAQRAYDLVAHTVDNLSSYAYDTCHGQELMEQVPDMDELYYGK